MVVGASPALRALYLAKGLRQRLRILVFLPLLYFAAVLKLPFQFRSLLSRSRLSLVSINEREFPNEAEFDRILRRIGDAGLRSTASKAHNDFIDWLESELRRIPGLRIESKEIQLLGWLPKGSLCDAGRLILKEKGRDDQELFIAGVVPYSLPTAGQEGELVYIPPGKPLATSDIQGKVVLRDFPLRKIPYALGTLPAYSATPDLSADLGATYERPGLADQPIHEDLIAAGELGAAGVIYMFDLERQQVESYWEPHKGTHYRVPAAYVGVDEGLVLKQRALSGHGCTVSLSVYATATPLTTRNLTAILPGSTAERIVYITHTDGNTYVQENGAAALLTLAQYFASAPLHSRRRTLEFAFNAGHLHISKEGSLAHAKQLSKDFDKQNNKLTLVVPVEHLGTREMEAVPQPGKKPGRSLRYTGRGELMFWCTGPSIPVVRAAQAAISHYGLDRVLLTRGVSFPARGKVPTFTSFGGIGTYYHNLLVPTTSLISGPWSLWAFAFGIEAVDLARLRRQTLALGHVYLALEGVEWREIVGGYAGYRKSKRRVAALEPSERAEHSRISVPHAVKY
ncbi:hypothetical protein BJX65DRAFT_314420 [Aspergillus insuetus]